jgi:hypothetical protein
MSSTLFAIVASVGGVLVGAVIAGLFSLLGPSIQSRREHRRWLREARLTAYSAYLAAIDLWMDTATTRRIELRYPTCQGELRPVAQSKSAV